ncbi:polyprotein [Drepanopeziza brunnea f. sp. 'multigermtubi' MB_m1]|uniref:Polyprotein n=1 Tax=Marssonina brunnea f. sp. multigermtubi (strain MB_m1) TaxID=1072389 RepID=K1WW47_MARBU|nr:polyprotein [Drepanopeziza brunnea f. sp. 'multigermtubi' MB_m1]EKD16667.1 polyprotein [Drepanopeziza brunnea f. sp. 'multigermtubi' MB_m1]
MLPTTTIAILIAITRPTTPIETIEDQVGAITVAQEATIAVIEAESTKHSPEERKRSYDEYKKGATYYTTQPVTLAYFASFLADYERVEGIANEENHQDQATYATENYQYDEYDHGNRNYFTQTFLTEAKEVTGAETIAILQERSAYHAFTTLDAMNPSIKEDETVLLKTYISHSRYSAYRFQGFLPDSRAAIQRFATTLKAAGEEFETDILEKITKYCAQCQLHEQAPRRFKISLKDEYEFNYSIIVDIMYINGDPVLHIVDSATGYGSRGFLKNMTAKHVWDTSSNNKLEVPEVPIVVCTDSMTKINPNKSLATFIDTNKANVRVEGWVERA